MSRAHTFDSTGDAYNATQCDESIKSGALLLIESEHVVGLAGTWPIAVTVELGELHGVTDPWSAFAGMIPKTSTDCDYLFLALLEAVEFADANAWPVAPWAREILAANDRQERVTRARVADLMREARLYRREAVRVGKRNPAVADQYRATCADCVGLARHLSGKPGHVANAPAVRVQP